MNKFKTAVHSKTPRPTGDGIVIVAGMAGMGKSTFVANQAVKYIEATGNKVYVVDPQGTFPVPKTHAKNFVLMPFNFSDANSRDLIFDHIDSLTDAMVIYDDIKLYSGYGDRVMINTLIKHRHRNLECFACYHSLKEVHVNLWPVITNVVVFQVRDRWENIKDRIELEITEEDLMFLKSLKPRQFVFFKGDKVEFNKFSMVHQ